MPTLLEPPVTPPAPPAGPHRPAVRALRSPGRAGAVVAAAVLSVVVLLGLLVAALLPGSTGTSSTSSGSGSTSSGSGGSSRAPLGAPEPAVGKALGVPSAGSPAADARTTASGTVAGVRVVRTGSVALEAPRGQVSAVLGRVQTVVAAAGGYVQDSTTDEAGGSPSGTVTLRVPVAAYERVVGQVRGLATVLSASSSGEDVTGTYADLQAQVASLTAARSRFLAVLSGAQTIAETLSVQQGVDDVQGRIDRLEAQRRVLAGASDLGTLTVTVAGPGRGPHERTGFAAAWHDAVAGFTSGLQAVLARSGRVLVALLLLGLLAGLAGLVVRAARRPARPGRGPVPAQPAD